MCYVEPIDIVEETVNAVLQTAVGYYPTKWTKLSAEIEPDTIRLNGRNFMQNGRNLLWSWSRNVMPTE